MTRSTDKKASECHVLDFFYDDEDGCALTVFVNGARFHIIADAERLQTKSESGKAIENKYKKLISAVRDETEEEADPDKFRQRKEFEAAEMHNPENEATNSFDSGNGTEDSTQDDEQDGTDDDSAVDVSEVKHDVKEIGIRDSGVVLGDYYAPESEKELQNWMLSPFGDTFRELAPASNKPTNQNLEDWYHGPAYFFNLEIEGDELSSSQIESTEDLEKRMVDLVPRMPVPKYIKELQIPLFQAKDIAVLAEGSEPEPYHPTRVQVNGETHFLKMVDRSQHQPTKREIRLLKEVEKKGLHKKFNVPLVLGLVFEKSKTEIMGFLQTDIEDPTPLTKMLDSDVVEDNRERWANETERIMKLLHENDIIWGDAKADNFMVDKHGELWIIDFGGSYTDGWVDPELMETQEGDDMGTEKIINALKDPDANTFEPDEAQQGDDAASDDKPGRSQKRPRDEDSEQEDSPSKRRR